MNTATNDILIILDDDSLIGLAGCKTISVVFVSHNKNNIGIKLITALSLSQGISI